MIVLGYLLLIVYFIFSIKISWNILKSITLTRKQKIRNILLTWLVPFIWGYIVNTVIEKDKIEVITKDDREVIQAHFTDNLPKVNIRNY
jgi:cell division protein FtsN